jgi:hypothetical protein
LDDIDGRFPGSRVVAVRSILPGTKAFQWNSFERRLAAYSCEDSYGIDPPIKWSHRIPYIRFRGTVGREAKLIVEWCQISEKTDPSNPKFCADDIVSVGRSKQAEVRLGLGPCKSFGSRKPILTSSGSSVSHHRDGFQWIGQIWSLEIKWEYGAHRLICNSVTAPATVGG